MHFVRALAHEVHLDAPVLRIVAREVAKVVAVEVAVEFAVDAIEQVQVELVGILLAD